MTSLKSRNFDWSFKIARLIDLSLRYISEAPGSENISPIMRFLEIYTAYEEAALSQTIYAYLVTKDYYGHLRKLCDARIPPIMTETLKPPTPMAETIFNLLMQPLSLISSEENDFAKNVLLNLTVNFLSEAFSEQLDFYVVPSLAAQPNFPYVLWSKVLHQNEVKPSPWLLYSFLKIGKIHLGQDQGFDVHTYLSVLSDLTGAIMDNKTVSCMSNEENESEDEDESKVMDVECTDMEASNIQRSVVMLNDEQVVASLVAATEKSPNEPLALTALCKLCHNLLLSDPLALHHFRLLYTLAFRPVLLHRLWNLILDTKRPSLMGSSIPLLTVISRGIRLSVQERDAIVPLLAVFASLFCYLLVTIHDTEFYGDEVGSGANIKIWMPFTLSELVPMSLSLRDVTLGLIELAFPQSRPAVREEYQLAVK